MKKKEKEKSSRSGILLRLLLVLFIGGLFLVLDLVTKNGVFFHPGGSKNNQKDTMMTRQFDFPLSKVTVSMSRDEMLDAFSSCDWLQVSYDRLQVSKIKKMELKPAPGREAEYREIVNEQGMAARISELYSSEGFEWNSKTDCFTLPSTSKEVLVPTWILFKMVESGAFPSSSQAADTIGQ